MLFGYMFAGSSANSCVNAMSKAYSRELYDAAALDQFIGGVGCPEVFDPTASMCTQDFTAELEAIIDPQNIQCPGPDKILGSVFCGACVDNSVQCNDGLCDQPCRTHAECATDNGEFLYCASIQDRVSNGNFPHLAPWSANEGPDFDSTRDLEDDPGRCRPTGECLYFHDAALVCTSDKCSPGNKGEFGGDFHRACPNLLNKNTVCTSNADCKSSDLVKGGDGFCPTEGHWKNCYEDFFCCATKEGLTQYGYLAPDEFDGDCVQDCSTAYKCGADEIWDLMEGGCVADSVADSRRRFLNLGPSKTQSDDTTQANLDKAKNEGKLAGSKGVTGATSGTPSESDSASLFAGLFLFLLGSLLA